MDNGLKVLHLLELLCKSAELHDKLVIHSVHSIFITDITQNTSGVPFLDLFGKFLLVTMKKLSYSHEDILNFKNLTTINIMFVFRLPFQDRLVNVSTVLKSNLRNKT